MQLQDHWREPRLIQIQILKWSALAKDEHKSNHFVIFIQVLTKKFLLALNNVYSQSRKYWFIHDRKSPVYSAHIPFKDTSLPVIINFPIVII